MARKMADLISAQAESGKTKKAYCEEQGISLPRFYYWQRRLSEIEESDATDCGFTALNVCGAEDFEIRLENGYWLRVRTSSAEALRLLIDVISQSRAEFLQ